MPCGYGYHGGVVHAVVQRSQVKSKPCGLSCFFEEGSQVQVGGDAPYQPYLREAVGLGCVDQLGDEVRENGVLPAGA